ncbi:MAG TPA: hypothetical protein VFU02_03915 [Polyangiaceae bacterium]|nr:hypothetical protein [Polyangiaceae bacterium]
MDPERLGPDCSQFEAEILRAGRADAMPENSGRTILAALGVTSPVAASSAVAVGGKLAFMKGVFIVAGIGAAGTLAIWGARDVGQRPTQAPVAAPQAVVAAPVDARPEIEAIDVGALPASEAGEAGDEPAPPHRPAVTAPVTKLDTLPLELEAIDNARKALAQGNAALASRLLDRYAARFPKPRLRAEATVLRIETLIARGDRAAASRLGKAFLQNNSKSPYARRVRSLIGDTTSSAESSPGDR